MGISDSGFGFGVLLSPLNGPKETSIRTTNARTVRMIIVITVLFMSLSARDPATAMRP